MQLTVRGATQADRQQLANLIHFEVYVHRHLDWRTPLDWLNHSPYLVAEQLGELAGALACPLDEPEIPWIRMFAAWSGTPLKDVWQVLWEAGYEALSKLGHPRMAAIVMQGWFRELLVGSGFVHTDNVVMLLWERGNSLPHPRPITGMIRVMMPEDLDPVGKIDALAFEEEWRNSASALELAYQQAALATVAEDEGRVIGYQISTSSLAGGHLARLAVLPEAQCRGTGYALVHNLLDDLQQRGISHVTVNTQQDNPASLAVYARAGFKQTDEQYQVYQYFAR